MLYECGECAKKIETLNNLRAERSNINRIGEVLIIHGECPECGNRYAFIPELGDAKRIKKPSQTWESKKFGVYLANKLGEKLPDNILE